MRFLKFSPFYALICCAALAQSEDESKSDELSLTLTTDRADSLYAVGEEAVFQVFARQGSQPVDGITLECVVSKDGVAPVENLQLELRDGIASIRRTLDEPGFLRVRISAGDVNATAAAGFDPLDIKPSMPPPEDFDDFWAEQLASLAEVPVNAELTPFRSPVPGVKVFDVTVEARGAAPVRGYLALPEDATERSLPGLIYFHGAGVRSALPGRAALWAKEGLIVFEINAHGVPNGKDPAFYQALAQGELANYKTRGFPNREDIYFTEMFLRAVRAIDFLATCPEWDGKKLAAYGNSQGAFQAIVVSALDERVTFVCAGVPAGCDHTGFAVGRANGWPAFVAEGTSPDQAVAICSAVGLFDNVNFASRLKAKGAAVTVGFIDHICTPTGVFAAFNAIRIPKTIHHEQTAGHTITPAADHFLREAAMNHLHGEDLAPSP